MLATIESSLAQYTRDLCAQQAEAEGTPLRLRTQRRRTLSAQCTTAPPEGPHGYIRIYVYIYGYR